MSYFALMWEQSWKKNPAWLLFQYNSGVVVLSIHMYIFAHCRNCQHELARLAALRCLLNKIKPSYSIFDIDISICFVWFCFISFRSVLKRIVSIAFVSFRFVSFRLCFVSYFVHVKWGGLLWQRTLKLCSNYLILSNILTLHRLLLSFYSMLRKKVCKL